jgi:hypothetical protein
VTVVLTLLVRDEQDVIEANLRHHFAKGVDFVIATDNRSLDGTRALLEAYERRGRLRIIDEPQDDYDQARWVTRMARLAATDHDADWVINGDADEFWWPKRGDLKEVFDRVGTEFGSVAVPRLNFPPTKNEDAPFYERMLIRETQSLNISGDPLPAKVAHRARPDVVVEQGNHAVHGPRLAPQPGPSPLVILHFPLRSYAQLENKIVKGGQAYERNPALGPEVGAAWRMLYQRYQAGTLRDYYDAQVVGEETIAARIGAGTLMADHRLRHELGAQATDGDDDRGRLRVVATAPVTLPAGTPASSAAMHRVSAARRLASRVRREVRVRAKNRGSEG